MRRTSVPELTDLLRALGVVAGDRVMLHTSLFSLGLIEDGAAGFERALKEVVGVEGTIIVPTFTFSFRRGEVFDLKRTPADRSLGMFPERIRTLPEAFRSSDPLFSKAAIGRDAEHLMQRTSVNCFGRNSVYHRLFEHNVVFVCIGITYSTGLSAFMHLEKLAEVPYRREMKFDGRSRGEQGEYADSAIHFMRQETLPWSKGHTNREPMGRELEQCGISTAVNFGNGHHFALRAQPFQEYVLSKVLRDPLVMFDLNDTVS
jgi:aminoglycoside 3-N-acetyltransferase